MPYVYISLICMHYVYALCVYKPYMYTYKALVLSIHHTKITQKTRSMLTYIQGLLTYGIPRACMHTHIRHVYI